MATVRHKINKIDQNCGGGEHESRAAVVYKYKKKNILVCMSLHDPGEAVKRGDWQWVRKIRVKVRW